MIGHVIEKAVLTAVMVAWYVWMPVTGYGGEGCNTAWEHLVYMWSHANIWHLLGNLFVLWICRGRLHVMMSVVIAFVCSWLPNVPGVWDVLSAAEPLSTVTVGFSGVLFAMGGIKWGIYCRRVPFRSQTCREFCKEALPFALLGAFIPHINWCIHLYCLIAGFVYGMITKK